MSRSVVILMVCVGLIGSNGLILSPVLPVIAVEFNNSVAEVGRAIAAFSAGTAATALWFGRAIDGFGANRALKYAMVAGGLGQVLASFSTGWETLALTQVLTGAASGIALPAIYALTAEVSSKGREAKIMGQVLFGWSVSLVFAIPLGAYLADLMGWRLMLVLVGALCMATFVFTRNVQTCNKADSDAITLGRLAPLTLPGGWRAYLVCALFMTSFYGSFSYSGAHVVSSFGQSVTSAGLIALFYGLGFGSSSFFAHFIDRMGPSLTRLLGFPLATIILLGMATAPTFAAFLTAIALWGAINNVLLNTIVTGLTALAPGSKGAVLGLHSSVTYFSAAVGTFLMGVMYDQNGFWAVGGLAAGLHVFATVLLLITKPSSQIRANS